VQPKFKNPADDEALDRIFEQLGIDIYSGEQEDTLPDAICKRADVRDALEAAGYDAVRTEAIALPPAQYDAVILWKPETFEVVPQPTDVRDFSIGQTPDGNLTLSVNTAAGAQKYINWDWQEDEDYGALKNAFREATEGLDGFTLVDPSAVKAKGDAVLVGKNVTLSKDGVMAADAIWEKRTPLLYHVGGFLLSDRTVVFQPVELKPVNVLAVR